MCDGHDVQCISVLMRFHLKSRNPISTKQNGDLGPGTHHHQHSIMVEGYSNHGNWIPVLSSLKIWHLCKVSKTGRGCPSFFGSISHACTRACTGASCAPHVRAWQYLTTRTLGKPKVSPRRNIPSTASKQALNGLFRGLWRRFIPHSTPRLRLVVPIVSET